MTKLAKDHPLCVVCRTLGVSRSSFYIQLKPMRGDPVKKAIAEVAGEWPKYGYRRVERMLRRRGIVVNHKRVLGLMNEMGIAAKPHPRKVRTTRSDPSQRKYPNLVQGLEIVRPDQVWASDITYVRLGSGFVYLAIVIDLYTRAIRGWHLSRRLDTSLVIAALWRARRSGDCEIHHSDQGCQYASEEYVTTLGTEVGISMADAGCAWQNGYAERVIKTIKEEEIDLSDYADFDDTFSRIGSFIEDVYYRKRIHSSLGYLTPEEFEKRIVLV